LADGRQPRFVGAFDRGNAYIVGDVIRDIDLVPRGVDQLDLLGPLAVGPDVAVLVAVPTSALLGLLIRHARGAHRPGAIDEHVWLVRLREVTGRAQDARDTREVDVGDPAAAERDRWRSESRRAGVADVPVGIRRPGCPGGAHAAAALDVDASDVYGGRARGAERVLVGVLVDVSGGANRSLPARVAGILHRVDDRRRAV